MTFKTLFLADLKTNPRLFDNKTIADVQNYYLQRDRLNFQPCLIVRTLQKLTDQYGIDCTDGSKLFLTDCSEYDSTKVRHIPKYQLHNIVVR